jgi:hypothetical protein
MAEKALTGNNVMVFAEKVHNQWLGKQMVSFLMLQPLHQKALAAPVSFHHHALAVKKI